MHPVFDDNNGTCFICGRMHQEENKTWVVYEQDSLRIVCFKKSCMKEAEKESN